MDQAFLLHRAPFKDDRKILHWLTASHGRISTIAHDDKDQAQLFQLHEIVWYGHGDLVKITDWKAKGPVLAPVECFIQMMELHHDILKYCRRWVSHDKLMANYWAGLRHLHAKKLDIKDFVRLIQNRLLLELGIGINWQFDCNEQPLDEKLNYRWQVGKGWVKHSTRELNNTGVLNGTLIKQMSDNSWSPESDDHWLRIYNQQLSWFKDNA